MQEMGVTCIPGTGEEEHRGSTCRGLWARAHREWQEVALGNPNAEGTALGTDGSECEHTTDLLGMITPMKNPQSIRD